jgi:histidinol-phosphate aminotransferase
VTARPEGVATHRPRVVHPWVDEQHTYAAGKKASAEVGSLAANESQWGASPRVAAAVAASMGRVHRYPDPLSTELREAIAAHHGIDPASVLVGSGSDEFFFTLSMAYANRGRVVCAAPRYWGHEVPGRLLGGEVSKVPLADHTHDLGAMARIAGEVDADIVYVCNPHNPTGTAVTRDRIEAFLDVSPAPINVIDEAYVHAVGDLPAFDTIPLAAQGRCVTLRTFSKLYGLAGIRLGYVVGPVDLIDALIKARPPFSVSVMAQAAGLAALADQDHVQAVVAATHAGRAELTQLLLDAGLHPIPSQANFVAAMCGSGEAELALIDRLRVGGVSVRSGTALGLPGLVRITVPDPAGMALLSTLLLS